MRLLAATSGRAAQGRLTEAGERVGEITTDGTIGFLLFVGVGGGLATALASSSSGAGSRSAPARPG